MKRKRNLVLITFLVMASLLAACGQSSTDSSTTSAATTTTAAATDTTVSEIPNFNPTGYPIVNEPIKLKMMNVVNANGGPYGDDMSFFRAMKELTSIDFEFANIGVTEWDTKLGLSLAANDLPDIYFANVKAANIVNYGVKGGMFVDYSDLADDYMPHLQSWEAEYPDMLKYVTQVDGSVYSFPRILAGAGDTQVTMSVRLDRMNEAGIDKVPETVDEFYEMCKAIQTANANDPEFHVFASRDKDMGPKRAFEKYFTSAFGDYTTADWHDDGTGKVFYNGVTDQVYRYLEFANRLFKEKIICNEVFTMDSATNTALHKDNKTAVSLSYTSLSPDNFESGNMDFTILAPLTSEFTSVKKIVSLPGVQDTGIVITTECEHVEALLRWIDIHYAKEDVIPGLDCISPHKGIRGETWDYTDETKQFYKFIIPSDWTLSDTEFIYHRCGHGALYMAADASLPAGASPGLEVKVRDSVKSILPYMVPDFPFDFLKYSEEEMDEYANLWTDLETYMKQMKAKFIIGEEPLSNWPAYVETLNKMGLPRVTEIVQDAYDRWNEN